VSHATARRFAQCRRRSPVRAQMTNDFTFYCAQFVRALCRDKRGGEDLVNAFLRSGTLFFGFIVPR
jgi:hypothetical protein